MRSCACGAFLSNQGTCTWSEISLKGSWEASVSLKTSGDAGSAASMKAALGRCDCAERVDFGRAGTGCGCDFRTLGYCGEAASVAAGS